MEIDGVKVLGVDVVLGVGADGGDVDFGSITLGKDDREYILDSIQTYHESDGTGRTMVLVDVEQDEDMFPECEYDLTSEDLLSDELDTAEMYIQCVAEVESIHLVVEVDTEPIRIKLELD